MTSLRPSRRSLVAAMLMGALLVAVSAAAPASAHATLVDSSPRQNQHLEALPDQVRFIFNEDMSGPAYVAVTGPDSSSVTTGAPRIDGPGLSQTLTDGPDGTYTMSYRAVSQDGHSVTGEITFSVGATDRSAVPDPPQDTSRHGSVLVQHQVAVYAGLGLFVLTGLTVALIRRTAP